MCDIAHASHPATARGDELVGPPADSTNVSRNKRCAVEVTNMDSTTNRGEPDRSRISLLQQHEVTYWTKRFGVSREQLEEATGPSQMRCLSDVAT